MKSIIISLGGDSISMNEVNHLAKSMGYNILRIFRQNKKPRPKYLIGSGKAKEIGEYINNNEVELAIFENFLTSSQILALEDLWRVPVIDKFDLILNVFEKRANDREAKLQIELARLRRKKIYIKKFLGIKVRREHPGFGGAGEFIIHSTMDSINKRIKKIEEDLKKFELRIDEQTKRRGEIGKIVSLAGYTNSGKTTLLNALTKTNKDAKDELFTTLSTKTSSFRKNIFINDTIGFIKDLPHELIYAFRATLKDIKNSDMILLVIDASESIDLINEKIGVCIDALSKIKADEIPTAIVLNKIDLIKGYENIKDEIKMKNYDTLAVSAKNGNNLNILKEYIIKNLT